MVYERVVKLLSARMGIPPETIVPSSTLAGDLGLDSLDRIELWLALESEFGLRILKEEYRSFKTVAHIVGYLSSH